ncbi:QacE family quaternary ammonium compound efflux SMR transporter [Emticicia sp. CRIBPO]|jgi:quaternary ammonium compound-resistance protein SugE|uniref:DMT family transporter n=1 Tax=Emticicia sp. CRIBPO TaxID=2683258 RepID=UPI00141276E7|nr:multidrug efflux SMR transporter [Emticicia sp. CRIBPO]NBA85194.1 QacE family quaternary ammonium compound efflux SMR transporter [Emticicia sp. CRIBPO]
MPWLFLFFAGLLEILWAYSMKLSEGFSKPIPSLVTIVAMIASFGLLSLALKTLPIGTAYTIWTGIGAVGAFVIGILVFGEALTVSRAVAALLIISGIVLMKVSG